MLATDLENIAQMPTSTGRSFSDRYAEDYSVTDIILGSPEDTDSQSRIVEFDKNAVDQLYLPEEDEASILERLKGSFNKDEYDFNIVQPIEVQEDGNLIYNIPLSTESIVNSNSDFNGSGPLRDVLDAIRSASKNDRKLFQALRTRISIDINNDKPVINFFVK